MQATDLDDHDVVHFGFVLDEAVADLVSFRIQGKSIDLVSLTCRREVL